MLDTDDLAPPPKPANPTLDLQTLSIADLEARIVELEREIVRVREVIAGKRAQRDLAEAFFKSV